ncbi:MAG: YebC/PmpR family DNA-binding transcriptional regulator [Patescibacteria group bacterium]
MSRHSKWSKVKQFKGAVDAKRSASFTKLAREIQVAAKEKGADPSLNLRLRVAIDRARRASMPKDSIERAVERGSGAGGEGQIDFLVYEAYGPGGTALIIECLTDNRNRSANDVKHLLTKHGASLAASGSVTYLFDHQGVVRLTEDLSVDRHEEIELSLIDAGAEDMREEDSSLLIVCDTKNLSQVAEAVEKHDLTVESAELEWLPKLLVETDEETGMIIEDLITALEELDDVSKVYSNLA